MFFEKYLFKNPLNSKEKNIIKASLEYSIMTMSYPTAHLDALTLAKQEFTEICTAEGTNQMTVRMPDLTQMDKNSYRMTSTSLPTKKKTNATISDIRYFDAIENVK